MAGCNIKETLPRARSHPRRSVEPGCPCIRRCAANARRPGVDGGPVSGIGVRILCLEDNNYHVRFGSTDSLQRPPTPQPRPRCVHTVCAPPLFVGRQLQIKIGIGPALRQYFTGRLHYTDDTCDWLSPCPPCPLCSFSAGRRPSNAGTLLATIL